MARQAGEAVLRHPGGVGDDGFLQVLAEGLVLTGIAMSISGDTRPASGACHEINHAFDLLFPKRAAQPRRAVRPRRRLRDAPARRDRGVRA